MTRIAVEIPVRIPLEQCRRYVLKAERNDSYLQAYAKLRNTGSSSDVTEDGPNRLVVREAAYDPFVKAHMSFSTGWRIIYEFRAMEAGRTMVGITVEYGKMLALLSMGLAKPQAESEILHRINALLAYEQGLGEEREPSRERLLGAAEEKVRTGTGEAAGTERAAPEAVRKPNG